MELIEQLIENIETHDVDGIRDCFQSGVDPNASFRGRSLFDELTSEYGRGPRFKDCVRAFVDHGLVHSSEALLACLLDDAGWLGRILEQEPLTAMQRFSLRCAYTPLYDATLLHVCAEFNHVDCAQELLNSGADVNAPAGIDADGFGGHTPIFHTVNQNGHHSSDMLELLLRHGADLSCTVRGLVWGRGYPWETLIPAVNPISYAMMGMLPQMHRHEVVISRVVQRLINHHFGIGYELKNVPNRYLS